MPTVRRWLTITIIVIVVLIIGWMVYENYLAPDPTTILRTRATNIARRAILNKNWDVSLRTIKEATESLGHQDWELLTWYIVLLEKNETRSDGFVEQALAIGNPDDVWITYGMVAVLADEPTMVLRAGEELINENENSVQGYYLVAQSYDIRKDFNQALHYYELTLDQINRADGHEGIYITVRQRVAQINLELMAQEVRCC